MTNLITFTIDPIGARDLDDAISVLKTEYGFKAYVHIADVSYFVKPNNYTNKWNYTNPMGAANCGPP